MLGAKPLDQPVLGCCGFLEVPFQQDIRAQLELNIEAVHKQHYVCIILGWQVRKVADWAGDFGEMC